MSMTMEEQWRCPACIPGKMSTLEMSSLSITDDDDAMMMMMPEEEEKFGEEVIGKRIRIYDEGWVIMLKNSFYRYAFERDDDKGTLEILLLKDQMMELGIIEKEEDMDGRKIRVYDEGVVTHFHQKLGMHSVQLENGRTKALIFHQDHHRGVVWEWEWEWHLRGKSSQLPSLKRIWNQDSPRKYWGATTTTSSSSN